MHRQLKQNMNKRDEQASQKKKEEDIQKANKHIKIIPQENASYN